MPPMTSPVNLIGMPIVKPIVEPDEFNSPVESSYGFNLIELSVASVLVTLRANSVYKISWSLAVLTISKTAPCAEAAIELIGGCDAYNEIADEETSSLLK